VLNTLGGAWRLPRLLWPTPAPLRDALYRWIAQPQTLVRPPRYLLSARPRTRRALHRPAAGLTASCTATMIESTMFPDRSSWERVNGQPIQDEQHRP